MNTRDRHLHRRILSASAMKAADEATIERWGVPGNVLMERAALACRRAANQLVPQRARLRRASVLVGPGNNGGDGSALARLLHLDGWQASIVLAADRSRLQGDALAQLDLAERFGVRVLSVESLSARESLLHSDLWVDALLGIGTTTAPRRAIASALGLANTVLSERADRPRILAVDLPSGVHSDNGIVFAGAIHADHTVTFAHRKWCHCLPPAIARCGTVTVSDIGLPTEAVPDGDDVGEYVTLDLVRSLYRPHAVSAHKGSAGRVLVMAGSESMPGAASLVCSAAMRSGAGLVYLHAPLSVRNLVIARHPEVVGVRDEQTLTRLMGQCDSIVAGPGWELTDDAAALLDLTFTRSGGTPTILDATALRLVAKGLTRPDHVRLILTPHPGELAALLGRATDDVVEALRASAQEAARRYNAVVIAKTAGALVWNDRAHFVPPGSPGMATAGSGDVLAGIVAALAARHERGPAAIIGTFLHAQAGASMTELGSTESLTASRIVDGLDAAFRSLATFEPSTRP